MTGPALHAVESEDDNGPKGRFHEFGSEDGEMADVLETALNHEVLFNHGKNQWHIVNPKTGLWLPDKVRDVQDRVDDVAVERISAAALGGSANLKLVKVYRKLREQAKIESSLKALASRDGYKTDGSIFDTDPYLLGVRNGVLDLRTLTLHRPDDRGGAVREMYVSQAAAAAWPTDDEGAVMKTAQPFLDFLLDILSGDEDLAAYVLRLLGYCLIGTTQEEKFWLLVGAGRNGKGTLTKFIHWLLGDYGAFLDPSLYIRGRWGDPGADRARPELGNLWGKRYAVTSEPVKGEFNEQMLKAHTGRDPITFRRMRSDVLWTFDPTHKLFFLTQDAPKVEDVGPSMRARARVLQFEQDYDRNGRLDQGLQARLKKIGQGALVLLAYQAHEYLREGLPENAKVLAWSDAYISDNDPLAQFLADSCEIGPGLTANATLAWNAWQDWCARNDREPGSQTRFGSSFGKRFERVRGESGMKYVGVRLKGATEAAESDQEGSTSGE